jgi:hypothetical protein
MDNQQQQRINRAAQEFTDALLASYRATSDRTVAAQEIEHFFDTVIDNLRAQADGTSQMTQQLATQQQLARVSTDNYMDLLDSVFSFYQGGASRTKRRVEEAESGRSEAESRRVGGEEGDMEADAVLQPQSKWVRTSGRSKVRGQNPRSRGRSSGRR